MAFTFQINNDLQFIHDEALLSMAEVNHPQIKKQTVLPTAIVDLVEDETKLNGCAVVSSLEIFGNVGGTCGRIFRVRRMAQPFVDTGRIYSH